MLHLTVLPGNFRLLCAELFLCGAMVVVWFDVKYAEVTPAVTGSIR